MSLTHIVDIETSQEFTISDNEIFEHVLDESINFYAEFLLYLQECKQGYDYTLTDKQKLNPYYVFRSKKINNLIIAIENILKN